MHVDLLRGFSDLASKKADLMRDEAQLWDRLSRDLIQAARRAEDTSVKTLLKPPIPVPPLQPAHPQDRNRLVSIADAARMMGIGRSKLYHEINASRLKVKKSGRRTLIAMADIEAWCDSLPGGWTS